VLVNSGAFTGLTSSEARIKISEAASAKQFGGNTVHYKIRDWLISRQRYWGAPIPIIHCDNCKLVPVPPDQLPVLLPENVKLSGRGSPLAQHDEWVNTKCPK
jgi:leucyl-tRNA synthetase